MDFECSWKGLKQFWKQRTKVLQAVCRSLKDNDRNGELRDILLKGQIAVNGDEGIELYLRSRE